MELKVGMYVRTNLGNIGKIVEEYTHQNYKVSYPEPQEWVLDTGYVLNEALMYNNEDIIKASYNIIDLIEVGDYVNGEKVEEIILDNKMQRIKTTECSTYFKEDIYSIVTREQFEQMQYKVGD